MRGLGLAASFLSNLSSENGSRLWLVLALSILAALLEGIGIWLLAPILAASGLTAAAPALPPGLSLPTTLGLEGLLLLWLGAVGAVTLIGAWREISTHALREDTICRWRLDLHARVTAMEWQWFQAGRASDVVAAMTQSIPRTGFGIGALMTLAAKTAAITVQMALALMTAPIVALITLGSAGLILAAQRSRFRRILSHGQAIGGSSRAFQAIITEHLGGMKLAKAHRTEAGFHAVFRRAATQWRYDQMATLRGLTWSRATSRMLMAAALTMVVWLAIRQTELSAPALLVLVAIMARLLPAFGDALHQAHLLAEALPAWGDLVALRQQLDRNAEPPAPTVPGPEGDVILDAVGFVWPGRTQPAITAINLTITANRTIALIGPSGGGKSTLADLCIGVLTPQSGQIRVGGQHLTGAVRAAWRDHLAYVPQDSFLLHDTIRANLTWLTPEADEPSLWRALADAALEPVIRALPQGLDTVIGDRGLRLSGGERQRLAIARALVRRPRFLVLDEATSHLDHASEAALQQALTALHGSLTLVVIAHRLETIRHADHIVVITNGSIHQQGRWEQLTDIPQSWLART
ncbi:ATPas [Candidatus Terasakiella magnetica]|nr:ATPas [Candidatus Terasakiella magnetica]